MNASNNYCDNTNHLHVLDYLQKYYDYITIFDSLNIYSAPTTTLVLDNSIPYQIYAITKCS